MSDERKGVEIVSTITPQQYGPVALCGFCKDCKHWNKPEEDRGPHNPFGEGLYGEPCDESVHPHRICAHIKIADNSDRGAPPKAYTMDASNYMANLWVAPDFGCMLFEVKP